MNGDAKGPPKEFAPRFKNLAPEVAAKPAVSPTSPDTPDEVHSSKASSSKRRTPLFLDLRKKDGTHQALSYSYLVAIGYDKKAITLEFTGYRVTLSGRNLDDVFRRLLAQIVGQIREVDELTDKATGDPKKPAVYLIEWEKV